jgi:hypothetical protein
MSEITNLEGVAIWSEEVENLLKEWSEKGSCYRWLHNQCEKKYRLRYFSFSIPVIILSTLTGAANVGLSSYVPEHLQSAGQAIIGGVNILVAWSKLGRNISIEMALDPQRRTNCSDFLTMCRGEYDRLIEQSPLITDDIINQFKKKFKNYDVSKPSITNGLDKCIVYKREDKLENLKYIEAPIVSSP